MKKLLLIVALSGVLFACKKDETKPIPTDYVHCHTCTITQNDLVYDRVSVAKVEMCLTQEQVDDYVKNNQSNTSFFTQKVECVDN